MPQRQEGFFASLFDLTFTEFVTTRIITLIYVLILIFVAIGALTWIANLFKSGGFYIGIQEILTPIILFLIVLGSRLWLEFLIVIFRISENTGRLVEQGNTQLKKQED